MPYLHHQNKLQDLWSYIANLLRRQGPQAFPELVSFCGLQESSPPKFKADSDDAVLRGIARKSRVIAEIELNAWSLDGDEMGTSQCALIAHVSF